VANAPGDKASKDFRTIRFFIRFRYYYFCAANLAPLLAIEAAVPVPTGASGDF
jgi:hypothetical protein